MPKTIDGRNVFPHADSVVKPDNWTKSDADVLIPKLGPDGDEIPHQFDAFRVLQHVHFRALRADIILGALEGDVLADDDVGDFIKNCGATAHRARRKRGVKRALLIDGGLETARIFQAIHFGMMNDASVLDTLVVAAPDD